MNSEETKMILNELSSMNRRFDKMDERFDRVDERLDKMDEHFVKLDNSVADIRLTLENETHRNIRFIAEGHVDLSRKLDEALKVENEKELLLIRVTALENEVRKIKERMDVSA